MGKARRNRLIRAQTEHKGEARQLRRRRWMLTIPRQKHPAKHPRIMPMPFHLSPEEWAQMVKTQAGYER